MSPVDLNELIKEVKENHLKLTSCKVHNFGHLIVERLTDRHKCLNCGGSLRLGQIQQYAEGYRAAGGNIDHIYTVPSAKL